MPLLTKLNLDLDDDLDDESLAQTTPTLASVESSSSLVIYILVIVMRKRRISHWAQTIDGLSDLLAPLLSASGRITDPAHIPRLLKIMATRKEMNDRKEITSLLDKSRSEDFLNA